MDINSRLKAYKLYKVFKKLNALGYPYTDLSYKQVFNYLKEVNNV